VPALAAMGQLLLLLPLLLLLLLLPLLLMLLLPLLLRLLLLLLPGSKGLALSGAALPLGPAANARLPRRNTDAQAEEVRTIGVAMPRYGLLSDNRWPGSLWPWKVGVLGGSLLLCNALKQCWGGACKCWGARDDTTCTSTTAHFKIRYDV
jgi:hypothetical protein